MEHFHSKLLEKAVSEFSRLPGIGRRTALRLMLHLLKQPENDVLIFSDAILNFRKQIKHCNICYNLSDQDICYICSNPKRNSTIVCVVESVRDILAIENTNQFNGVYHVLGGCISPMDGIGPSDLKIKELEVRIKSTEITELILALRTTMEGDTTGFYLYKKFNQYSFKISTIARGVAFGDELEYADEITLGRSIVNRNIYGEIN